jgi:hypothetical protein
MNQILTSAGGAYLTPADDLRAAPQRGALLFLLSTFKYMVGVPYRACLSGSKAARVARGPSKDDVSEEVVVVSDA